MALIFYFLDYSFKSYNVCAVKPSSWLLYTSIMPYGIATFWSFFACRTDELDAVNKLNEQKSGTILSLKQLLKKIGDKTFEWSEDPFTN